MAEAGGARRMSGSWRLSLSALALAVLVCVTASTAASAAAGPPWAQARAQGQLPIPGAFRLQASNGYTLYVASLGTSGGASDRLLLVVSGTHRGVTYVAPATITKTSIQADLGALGEIALTFKPSGKPATARCGKKLFRFDSGNYEGKIEFHGEEGYTDVEATSVPGNIDIFVQELCGEFVSSGGGPSRGAQLSIRNPALGPQLFVAKRRPGGAALIEANVSEYAGGIRIDRHASLLMPAGRFLYDRSLQTATLRPPAPFAGSARFDRAKKAGKRWSGDLTVDMPGRAGVPLTGGALRATLVPSE